MLRDFFLGKGLIDSRSEYKYALLRAQLGALLGAICFIYIFIDLLNNVTVYIPWYFGGMIASSLVIYLNRKHRYVMASVVLLAMANMLVFLIASLEDSQGGAFFYFVATSTISLVVFNPLHKWLGILFVGLSLALAAIAYFGEGLPIEGPQVGQNYEMISFTVNFTLGLLSSILVLIFVMNRNEESEATLIGQQEELRDLAKELEKSKNRYALAVEGTEAGIYEWDVITNKVYASARYKSLLGYDPDEDLNIDLETYKSMIHPDNRSGFSNTIKNAVEHGGRYQHELRIKRKNGRYRWFLDSGIISITDGSAKMAVGSIIDIHHRKIAEQQLLDKNKELEKANEELDRFVYRASHDMRAPLSTLLGLLNLAKLTRTKSEVDEYHKLMTNRINTMDGFIKEVTDYSRNARLEVKANSVNIFHLVDEIRQSYKFLADASGITLKIDIDPDLVIKVDRTRLNVILSNLIYNAIKYCDNSKPERFVKVVASKDKRCMRVDIIDNGIGIANHSLPNIFNMFFRATEKSEGSGLGLYIVKETVNRLQGSITCSSEENVGSTFKLRIPVDMRYSCTSGD